MRIRKAACWVISSLIAAAGLCSSAAYAQIEAVELQPLGDWQIEQLSDRCIVRRQFGDPAAPTTIELRTIDPWAFSYQTAILSEKYTATGEPFRAIWLPGGKLEEIDRFNTLGGDGTTTGVLSYFGMQDAAMESRVVGQDGPFNVLAMDPDYDLENAPRMFREGIESLLVVDAFEHPLLFATGGMDGVVQERDPCIKRVLTSHGVDPSDVDRDDYRVEMTNQQSLIRRVIRSVPSEIRREDGPTMIAFILYLDAHAQPTSCRLSTLPYDERFERRGCDLLLDRAEFEFKEGEEAQPTWFKASGFFLP